MSLERIFLFFKTWPVDGQMAGLAAIHARDRLIEPIAIELFERDLLYFRNLVRPQRTELESGVLHHADPLIAVACQLRTLVFDLLAAGLNLLDFIFELIAAGARRLELLIQLRFLLIEFGDNFQVGLGISFLL